MVKADIITSEVIGFGITISRLIQIKFLVMVSISSVLYWLKFDVRMVLIMIDCSVFINKT